jgi:hypothetical protein
MEPRRAVGSHNGGLVAQKRSRIRINDEDPDP